MLTRTGPRWRPGLLLQCCPTTTQCTCTTLTHTHTYTHNACPYIMVHPLPPPPPTPACSANQAMFTPLLPPQPLASNPSHRCAFKQTRPRTRPPTQPRLNSDWADQQLLVQDRCC
jgi:hypothetical protein